MFYGAGRIVWSICANVITEVLPLQVHAFLCKDGRQKGMNMEFY